AEADAERQRQYFQQFSDLAVVRHIAPDQRISQTVEGIQCRILHFPERQDQPVEKGSMTEIAFREMSFSGKGQCIIRAGLALRDIKPPGHFSITYFGGSWR